MTEGLQAFLRARLDEDEELARAAAPRSRRDHPSSHWVLGAANADGIRAADGSPVTRFTWPREGAHIVRWDPARVLAEVESKRQIIASYEEWRDGNTSGEMLDYGHKEGLGEAMEHLAVVYAGHPDYRDEWKP